MLLKKCGFTLMELLLVVALISIVSAVGMPTVYHNFSKDADVYMIDALMVELEYARSMGLMDLPDYATFKTTADSPEFECATQTKKLDGNVVFEQTHFLRFDNLGRLRDADGTASTLPITLSLKAIDKTIGAVTITPAGLVKRQ